MGGLRGKEIEREEEIKMDVKNGEKRSLSAAFEETFVGNCTVLCCICLHKQTQDFFI